MVAKGIVCCWILEIRNVQGSTALNEKITAASDLERFFFRPKEKSVIFQPHNHTIRKLRERSWGNARRRRSCWSSRAHVQSSESVDRGRFHLPGKKQ